MMDLEVHCRYGVTAIQSGFIGCGTIGVEYRVRPGGCHAVMSRSDLEKHEAHCGFSSQQSSANEIASLKQTISSLQQNIEVEQRKIETLERRCAEVESRILPATTIKFYTTHDQLNLYREPRDDSIAVTTVPANTEVNDQDYAVIQRNETSYFRFVMTVANGMLERGYILDNYLARVTSPSAPKVDAEFKLLLERSNHFRSKAHAEAQALANVQAKYHVLRNMYSEPNLSNARFNDIDELIKAMQHKINTGEPWSPAERQHCSQIAINFYINFRRQFQFESPPLMNTCQMLHLMCVIIRVPGWSERPWVKLGSIFMELVLQCPQYRFA